jgi:hypothetical protein
VTSWRTFKATPATVISGETTNDPVIGTLATTSQASRILGYFTPQTLGAVGDTITLTFSVSFADNVGSASGQDNFRFALYGLNGEVVEPTLNSASLGTTNTDDLRGYAIGVDSGNAAPQGSTRKKDNSSSTDFFAAGTQSALGGANTGTNVTIASGPTYLGTMTLLRTLSGVDITASFVGNGGANAFSVSDNSSPFLTFGAVGFLNGGGISTDQVILQNVDVTFIPEPATWVLALGSVVSGLALRRRKN